MSSVEEKHFILPDETRELLERYQYQDKWVHHYTKLQHYLDIIEQKQYRLTRCDLLEDPHEGDLIDEYIIKAIRSLPDSQKREHLFDSYLRFQNTRVELKNVYIGSFCRMPESYLMWKAYGDNLTGGCISLKKKNPNDNRIKLVRVIYNDRSKKQLVKKIIQLIFNSEFLGPDYEGIFSFIFESLRFIFKKNEYSGEMEIRVIYYDNARNNPDYHYIDLETLFDIKGTLGARSPIETIGINNGVEEHKSIIELRTKPTH